MSIATEIIDGLNELTDALENGKPIKVTQANAWRHETELSDDDARLFRQSSARIRFRRGIYIPELEGGK